MVKYQEATLDATFSALADPTRRAILASLSQKSLTVLELAEPFDISLPAVSKHLRVLERAGLLKQEKEGRIRRCKLQAQPMKEAAQWIDKYKRFWEGQLDSLAVFLEKTQKDGKEKDD